MQSKKHRARRFRILETLTSIAVIGAAFSPATRAQTSAAQPSFAPSAGFDFGGNKTSWRNNGVRLDGNAFIKNPQLDARANTIAFDFAGRQVTSVRAIENVVLKLNFVPRGGGVPARVETTSKLATLDPVNRVLVLSGNVDGFYQLQGGVRNSLKGDKATLNYPADGQFSVVVEGGKNGVQLTIPPPEVPAGSVQQIGTITISGQNLSLDNAQSSATVTGNARAVSSGGATRFDIAAPSFTVSRDAKTGALSNLKTNGRTLLKVNLPEPTKPTATTPIATTPIVTTPIATANPTSSTGSNVGRATYFEIASDTAIITATRDAKGVLQLGTLIFDGKVAGFYRLQTPDGKSSDDRFTGDRAVVKNAPTVSGANDFQIDVTGAPVTIQTPFSLGF